MRAGAAQLYAGADASALVQMAAPSSDAATIPANDRYRVLIVVPLAQKTTVLRSEREGASKRGGEDADAEERRVEAQEERVRRACHTFEKNASEAVVYLINHDIIGPTADMVAGFLHRCTALNRRQTGSFLGAGIVGENLHHNPTADEVEQEKAFHQLAWTTFVDRCNIVAVPIDEALRSILLYFRLPSNRRSAGILLELAALQWFTKNREHGPTPGVFVPESQDIAVKLAFTVMMLNSEVHNPMVRSSDAHDAVYHAFVHKFRASVVDDPALAAKRKGNVLRKRDQPRVVTVMEVPADVLRAIYDRILANRLVTCSDTYATAPEFDVDWVRSPDIAATPLSDEQVSQDVEDIYCDPGFRDGILFNASSDRLPAKYSVDPTAWVRVTVRIPEPDSNFALAVRVVGASSDAPADAVTILPASRLQFHAANSACFVIRPRHVGHFTFHFVPEGSRARYYHPIPPRTIVVEGAFMRHVVQLSWKRPDPHVSHGRHLFGLDSPTSKSRWVHALDTALRASAGASAKDVMRRAERAAQALASLSPAEQSKSDVASIGTVGRSSADQGLTPLQLLGSLSPE
ncbi:SEC7-like protein [Coemansia reversa NRRL 1564]|uniref:SEC7-like protein n=1 Tax=Coemansia reversa (strain ATCC 12441 / NRRL 1564) TaxID=763665 RepID=A0A2G5B6N3_COERN|nr:SEC7-like protein [Coemansia reversa NRRL 1564]|eukprot:PIA14660.1 SEC7-like protein [Coemansia reversa NRRL 1564]